MSASRFLVSWNSSRARVRCPVSSTLGAWHLPIPIPNSTPNTSVASIRVSAPECPSRAVTFKHKRKKLKRNQAATANLISTGLRDWSFF